MRLLKLLPILLIASSAFAQSSPCDYNCGEVDPHACWPCHEFWVGVVCQNSWCLLKCDGTPCATLSHEQTDALKERQAWEAMHPDRLSPMGDMLKNLARLAKFSPISPLVDRGRSLEDVHKGMNVPSGVFVNVGHLKAPSRCAQAQNILAAVEKWRRR